VCISPNRAYSFEFEKGDGVFRDYDSLFDLYDLPLEIWPGHTGMYWQFLKYPPTEPWDQNLMEMQPSGLVLTHSMQHWINAVGEGDIWGVKTIDSLSASDRRKLVKTAYDFGARGVIFNKSTGYKNPGASSFRCDGLVEYCYEVVLVGEGTPGNNGGIVANDTWLTLSPLAMWLSSQWTTRTKGDPPKLTIREKDSLGKEIPEGGYTTSKSILVTAGDGNNGSGLTLLEVWKGNPDAGGSKVQSFPDNYSSSNTYSISGLSVGNYYIRCYDQAGNVAQHRFTIGDPRVMVYAYGGDDNGDFWAGIINFSYEKCGGVVMKQKMYAGAGVLIGWQDTKTF